MQRWWRAAGLTILLIFIAACEESDQAREDMVTKQTYRLCPKFSDSRQTIHHQLLSFAREQRARLIDRSGGAKQELTELGSNVLNKTGGNPILVTIEKPGEYRISITNLGLKEKIALTVRSSGETDAGGSVASLIEELGRSWTIQEVEDAVTNDPPC